MPLVTKEFTKRASDCRYTIESDSPDGGRSTYPECFGRNGCRGRIILGSDSLSTILRHWYRLMGGSTAGYFMKPHYPEADPERQNYWVCDGGRVLVRDQLMVAGHNETPFLPAFDDAGKEVS